MVSKFVKIDFEATFYMYKRQVQIYKMQTSDYLIDCVGVKRHVNPCGSFCVVSQRKWEDWLCLGLTIRQPLWVILCRLLEKGRKEIEDIVEEMKDRDSEERGTGMKVKKQKK